MQQNNLPIENLLPLYFEGILTKAQAQAVESWIEAAPENRDVAEEMANIYSSSDCLYVLGHTDTDGAYRKVVGRYRRSLWKSAVQKVERVAAILFIPLLLATIIRLYIDSLPAKVPMVTFATSPGTIAKVTLPDGTAVTLNSDTRITYPERFTGTTRDVTLSGEAYFAVVKDARRQFIVNTPYHAKVKVYGTHFDIDATPSDGHVVTTLEEGSVALSYLLPDGRWTERRINPGKQISYSVASRTAKVSDAELDVVTSWKKDELIFRDTPVREVLHMLSKRYGVTFVVRDDKVYSNSFTGTITRQRLDRVLEILSITSDLRFRHITDNKNIDDQEIIEVY